MDAIVAADHTGICFWKRVLAVYNGFKPQSTVERTHDQIRKKFSRITRALKRFTDIYEIQLRSVESSRSEVDIQALSCQLFNTQGWPKFGYWDEFLVLQDSPKFRAICEEERAPGAKRTRLGITDNYSSSSGSRTFDLNDDVSEGPSLSLSRHPRIQGQHAAIREARSVSQLSAAGASASRPTPAAAALTHTLEVQMMKQLQENLSLYERSTDSVTKGMYYDLILRLRSKLGFREAAETGAGDGSGGGGDDESGEEEVLDSNDAIE